MKSRFISYGVSATAVLGVLCLLLTSKPAAQISQGIPDSQISAREARLAALAAKPTPRLSNGKPDFSGYYRGGIAGVFNAQPDEETVIRTEDGSVFFAYGGALAGVEAADDGNTAEEWAANNRNPVPYKPEYQVKADELVKFAYGPRDNKMDPNLYCKPDGVIRSPISNMQIVQNENVIGDYK